MYLVLLSSRTISIVTKAAKEEVVKEVHAFCHRLPNTLLSFYLVPVHQTQTNHNCMKPPTTRMDNGNGRTRDSGCDIPSHSIEVLDSTNNQSYNYVIHV
jgi:hypothetical protein